MHAAYRNSSAHTKYGRFEKHTCAISLFYKNRSSVISTKELLQFSCPKHLNKDYNLGSRSIVCSWVRKIPFYTLVWWHGPALGVPGEHQEHPQSFLPAQLTHPSSPLLWPALAAEPGRATGISVPTAQGADKVLWQRAHRRVIFPPVLCM